jgi:hypothetical protein
MINAKDLTSQFQSSAKVGICFVELTKPAVGITDRGMQAGGAAI